MLRLASRGLLRDRVLEPMLRPQLRAWRGESPPALAFWGHGVFFSLVMILAYVDALFRADRLVQQALLTVFLLYTPWVLVAIWRCAGQARQPWDMISRLLVVAWGANTLLVAGWLQLDLFLNR